MREPAIHYDDAFFAVVAVHVIAFNKSVMFLNVLSDRKCLYYVSDVVGIVVFQKKNFHYFSLYLAEYSVRLDAVQFQGLVLAERAINGKSTSFVVAVVVDQDCGSRTQLR